MKHKVLFIFFIFWPILATLISFKASVNAFLSPILFFGVPSIILSLFMPQFIKKSLFASILMFPFTIIADYIAERTGAWLWPLPHSIFPFKLFTYIPLESLIWGFLQVYVVVIFFQFFFGKVVIKKLMNKRSEKALLSAVLITVIFLLALLLFPSLLNIPYWYLSFGTIIVIPVILEDIRYPKMFSRLLKTAIYFFYLNFTYEIAALKIGWWSFPSKQFIGYVSFLGVTFPFEEFIFWIVLSSLVVLSYYEYFFNAER